jgi:hypothetical protein
MDQAGKDAEAKENAAYVAQLNSREAAALRIAQRMLGTSFDLRKSNGFLHWKKTRTST